MIARILKGSKPEIAESVARLPGEVREAIVFVDEPLDETEASPEDLFGSMEPFATHAGGADYSREALYSRMEDETSPIACLVQTGGVPCELPGSF